MRTAPSNPTWTIVTFGWPWFKLLKSLDCTEFCSAIVADTVAFGEVCMLDGAGDTGVIAGAAPTKHQTQAGVQVYTSFLANRSDHETICVDLKTIRQG